MHPEFAISVEYYRLQRQLGVNLMDFPCFSSANCVRDEEIDDCPDPPTESISSARPAAYKGDILNDPDLLWSDDTWTEDKEIVVMQRLKEQGEKVSEYWRNKYEEQAGVYWHKFYKRNADHFYKDRHYLHVVFPELLLRAESAVEQCRTVRLLEVGCGVGNAVIPLIDLNPNLYVIAVDFAKSAISILSGHAAVTQMRRMEAHVLDIVIDTPPVPLQSLDLILCMFVLSAISPKHHVQVFKKLFDCLKPGGKLLFRDYGRYDEAQLRFKKGSKLDDNFYVRQDGTCSYFFTTEELRGITDEVGFQTEELEMILRQYANRKQRKARYRSWVHMKLMRPLC